jgi:methylthioribose-1-phosphate isomerase
MNGTGGQPVSPPEAVRWAADGGVDILDQTLLPETERRLVLWSADEMIEAIRALRVRGAPAIGIAAAMALAVEAVQHVDLVAGAFAAAVSDAANRLSAARPTAVNLAWAIHRAMNAIDAGSTNVQAIEALHREASRILDEDRAMCRRIGELGVSLLPDGARVLTQCNAGALATGGIGTALAPVYVAAERGHAVEVWAPETRPLLQGSRITAWELERAGVPVTVLTDSAVAALLGQSKIDLVIVGADRIAANGDVANKVGTYALALLARAHDVPFYVAAPTSTLDAGTPTGAGIPIEMRDPDEIRRGFGRLTAPAAVRVFSPAFDVTPAALITAIITERGILRPPFGDAVGLQVRDSERERERP